MNYDFECVAFLILIIVLLMRFLDTLIHYFSNSFHLIYTLSIIIHFIFAFPIIYDFLKLEGNSYFYFFKLNIT